MTKTKKIIAIIVTVVIVLGLGVLAFLYFSSKALTPTNIRDFMKEQPFLEDAEEFLKTDSVEVVQVLNGEACYRFDVVKEDGYEFTGENAKTDNVDLQAMKDGKLEMVVFCTLDDTFLVNNFGIIYVRDNVAYQLGAEGEEHKLLDFADLEETSAESSEATSETISEESVAE